MNTGIEEYASLTRLHSSPTSSQREYHHATFCFLRDFENGSLVKHKARLVARGFAQVFGVYYNGAHLYAPVMRLESFRVLASIAMLSDLDLRSFDVSAAHLHGDIVGEVYMEPPPGYGGRGSVLFWRDAS